MKSLTEHIFSCVREWRLAMGFVEQSNTVHECLYASESVELLTAPVFSEQADALADMAVILAGHQVHGQPYFDFESAIEGLNKQAVLNNVNLKAAFDIVMLSLYTKVCKTEEKEATDAFYSEKGMTIEWVKRDNDLWACYSADDYPDAPKGKILKPVTYKKPDWSGIGWRLDLRVSSHWNRPDLLPCTNTPILVTTDIGKIITAIRPDYVKNRKGNMGYWATDCMGKIGVAALNDAVVAKWQYI